jgi:hypothetical protein
LNDKPVPDIYQSFESYWDMKVEYSKKSYQRYAKEKFVSEELLQNLKQNVEKMALGIKGYNPHLDTMLHRFSRRMTLECNQALNELRKNPEIYAELKQRLSNSDYDKENEADTNHLLRSSRDGR